MAGMKTRLKRLHVTEAREALLSTESGMEVPTKDMMVKIEVDGFLVRWMFVPRTCVLVFNEKRLR